MVVRFMLFGWSSEQGCVGGAADLLAINDTHHLPLQAFFNGLVLEGMPKGLTEVDATQEVQRRRRLWSGHILAVETMTIVARHSETGWIQCEERLSDDQG